MSLYTIEEPAASVPHRLWSARHPLWALGFRPFYLLAALLAVLAIPLWLAQYLGGFSAAPGITLGWHMHEMVFGFAIAVIVGFLFTAGRTWTGLPTPHGAHLAALALLWIAGRIAMLAVPAWLAALVDLAFLPLAALAMFKVLHASGNKRNMFLVGLLGLLTLANAAFHGAVLGLLPVGQIAPIHAAILLIVLIESVIGGRIIPMFTDNGAPGGAKSLVLPRNDKIAMAIMVAAIAGWVLGAPGPLMAGLGLLACCATALRLLGWKPLRAAGVPLLWILHLSYAWISVGFLLLALAALGIGAASTAFHALAVGSMAGLILGMMVRTTLGHTGRKMVSGNAEVAMFALIQLGAVMRLAAALAPAPWRTWALVASGACWSIAFALFLLAYAPYLWRARVDGKEG